MFEHRKIAFPDLTAHHGTRKVRPNSKTWNAGAANFWDLGDNQQVTSAHSWIPVVGVRVKHTFVCACNFSSCLPAFRGVRKPDRLWASYLLSY